MKRLVLLAFIGCSFLALNTLRAQKLNVGVNLAGALPLSDFGEATAFGYGGDISLDYYFNDRFDLGIEAGLRRFAVDTITGSDGSVTFIPIQLTAGVHQDVDDWIDLYGELGLGLFLATSKVEGTILGDLSTSGSFFGFSPRIGAAFELTPTLFLDVNINYSMALTEDDSAQNNLGSLDLNKLFLGSGNASYLGLNVGLLYTLGEF